MQEILREKVAGSRLISEGLLSCEGEEIRFDIQKYKQEAIDDLRQGCIDKIVDIINKDPNKKQYKILGTKHYFNEIPENLDDDKSDIYRFNYVMRFIVEKEVKYA